MAEDSMKSGKVEVLQIDLDKKNLLVINFPDEEISPHHIMDANRDLIKDKRFKVLTEGLQDWIADKGKPFLCLGLWCGETVTLEKIGEGTNPDDPAEIAKRTNQLEKKVDLILKYLARTRADD